MSEGFITTKQAAILTGYRSDYVGQLAREGRINSIKKGKQRLVEVVSLFDYVSAKTAESNAVIEDTKTTVEANVRPTVESAPDLAEVGNEVKINVSNDNPATKKIVSPWVTTNNTAESPVASVLREESIVEAKQPLYSHKQYSAPTQPRMLTAGPEFELLPAVSTTAVVLAAIVFMFSVGTMISSERKLSFDSSNVASVQYTENTLREISKGWYKIVNNL